MDTRSFVEEMSTVLESEGLLSTVEQLSAIWKSRQEKNWLHFPGRLPLWEIQHQPDGLAWNPCRSALCLSRVTFSRLFNRASRKIRS